MNNHKSKLFVSRNTLYDIANALSRKFDIPLIEDLGLYLGIPVLHGRMTERLFHFIVSKLQ